MRKPNADKHNTKKIPSYNLNLYSRETKDYGTKSLKEYCEFVKADKKLYIQGTVGDNQLLARFLKNRQPVQVTPPIETSLGYDLSGDSVDVGLYLSGEPECMVNYYSHEAPAKLLDITIQTGRVWAASDAQVFAYYGMVLDIIDKLEARNLRCKITMCTTVCAKAGDQKINSLRVPIKEYHEPINMALFAGIVINNDWQTALYDKYPDAFGYGVMADLCTSYQLTQTDTSITFPSMYYNSYHSILPWDMRTNTYLKQIGLAHLID